MLLSVVLHNLSAVMMSSKLVELNIVSKFRSNDCFRFEFKVDKFSSITNVTTSQLVTSHACKTKWRVIIETTPRVRVNLNLRLVPAESKMRVGLKRTDANKCDVKASFFFEVLNSSKQVFFKESIERVFSKSCAEFYCDFIKRPGTIAQVVRGVEFAIPDDKLTISGSVFIHDCCPKQETENSVMNLTELQSNFKDLYQNNAFSDVVLSFGESNLHAHKVVLSSRSPVFKRMFEQDMIENKLNVVEITDIEKHVFDAFLLFLYTGVVHSRDLDTILSLYTTADKYEVTTLFATCSSILESYISDKTASAILTYADMHSDVSLKKKVVRFICDNFSVVEGTSGWSNLIDSNPRLASFTLMMISSSITSKNVKNI